LLGSSVRAALPGARHHGTDELHGACHAGPRARSGSAAKSSPEHKPLQPKSRDCPSTKSPCITTSSAAASGPPARGGHGSIWLYKNRQTGRRAGQSGLDAGEEDHSARHLSGPLYPRHFVGDRFQTDGIVGWKHRITGSSVIARCAAAGLSKRGIDIDAIDSAPPDIPYGHSQCSAWSIVRCRAAGSAHGFSGAAWGPNNNVFRHRKASIR